MQFNRGRSHDMVTGVDVHGFAGDAAGHVLVLSAGARGLPLDLSWGTASIEGFTSDVAS